MNELAAVVLLGLAMTAVVAVLAAALRWKQGQDEVRAARVMSVKRTASPGPVRQPLTLHNLPLHNIDAGAPDLLDFLQAEPVMGRREPGGSSKH